MCTYLSASLFPSSGQRGSADPSKPPRSQIGLNPPNAASLQKGVIAWVSFSSPPDVGGPHNQAEKLCTTMELFWDVCAAHPVRIQSLHPLLADCSLPGGWNREIPYLLGLSQGEVFVPVGLGHGSPMLHWRSWCIPCCLPCSAEL